MNGKYRFCVIWSCGCVLSERALKEVPTEICHKCGETFIADDVVVLNGNEKDVERLELLMEARRLKAKQAKKSKKDATSKNVSTLDVNDKKRAATELPDDVNNKTTVASKKIKDKHTWSSDTKRVQKPETDLPNNKTVAQDPKATKVYKNLFTSSEKAKGRSKDKVSNWVTYNPYHL